MQVNLPKVLLGLLVPLNSYCRYVQTIFIALCLVDMVEPPEKGSDCHAQCWRGDDCDTTILEALPS